MPSRPPAVKGQPLTPPERFWAIQVVDHPDKSVMELASLNHFSVHTAKSHLKRAYVKLGVTGRRELLVRIIRHEATKKQ